MLYKNTIKLLFLFIILLVSISAISAVDNSTDVTQEMGFNEVMGDRGSGSFTDFRVPAAHGKATRIEYRTPDPACNPYLAFAVMLETSVDGIEERLFLHT